MFAAAGAILAAAFKWAGGALWGAIQWAFANPLAAALGVALCACGWLWHEKTAQAESFTKTLQAMTADRDNERTRADAALTGRNTAVAANASLNEANARLTAANAAATALSTSAKAASAAALIQLRSARASLAASKAREDALRGQIYATDPAAHAWADLPVPDAIAGRLRESARQASGP